MLVCRINVLINDSMVFWFADCQIYRSSEWSLFGLTVNAACLWLFVFICSWGLLKSLAFSALTLLVRRQERHPACKKTECWGAGMVICLERGADLNMAQLMPLALTVSCFSKIQIGFTFLVPAHPGSPGQRAVKRVCVCVCVCDYCNTPMYMF